MYCKYKPGEACKSWKIRSLRIFALEIQFQLFPHIEMWSIHVAQRRNSLFLGGWKQMLLDLFGVLVARLPFCSFLGWNWYVARNRYDTRTHQRRWGVVMYILYTSRCYWHTYIQTASPMTRTPRVCISMWVGVAFLHRRLFSYCTVLSTFRLSYPSLSHWEHCFVCNAPLGNTLLYIVVVASSSLARIKSFRLGLLHMEDLLTLVPLDQIKSSRVKE